MMTVNALIERLKFPPLFVAFIALWIVSYLALPKVFAAGVSSLRPQGQAREGSFEIAVISDPTQKGNRFESLVTYKTKRLTCYWPHGYQASDLPAMGQHARIRGVVHRYSGKEMTDFSLGHGLVGEVDVDRVEAVAWPQGLKSQVLAYRHKLISVVLARTSDLQGPLMTALMFGYKSELKGFKDLFKQVGLSHMLAVSGAHFALAIGLIGFVARKLRTPKPGLVGATLLFSAFFYVMTGMSASTLRACMTASLATALYFARRRVDPLALIGCAGFASLVSNPFDARSLGFQLSYLAVIGIALCHQPLTRAVRERCALVPHSMIAALSLSITAQLFTLPLIIARFHSFSPLNAVSSVVTSALFECVIACGVIISLLGGIPPFEPVVIVLIKGCEATCSLLIECCLLLQRAPGMFVSLTPEFARLVSVAGACTAVVCVVALRGNRAPKREDARSRSLQRKTSRIITMSAVVSISLLLAYRVVVLPLFVTHETRTDGVYVLNVGQGDAILIKSQGQTALADAGPDPLVLKRALDDIGIRRVETLIFSHGHADHISGGRLFSRSSGVKRIIVAQGVERDAEVTRLSSATRAPILTVLANDEWRVGAFRVRVLSPRSSVSDPDDNGSCLVLSVDGPPYEEKAPDLVLTGDAEAQTLAALKSSYHLESIHTLKIGHHGSKASLTKSLINEFSIRSVVISVGENPYGHPNRSILSLLHRENVPFARTDKQGTIYVRCMAQ